MARRTTPADTEGGAVKTLEIEFVKGALHLNGRPAQFWLDECERLSDAVRSARADEAQCWAGRVDVLTAQLRAMDERYMALVKAVADGIAMQPTRHVVLASDQGPP
jgi:hypothetical protein